MHAHASLKGLYRLVMLSSKSSSARADLEGRKLLAELGFDGGAPGWQEAGEPASVETELKISPDGRQVEAEIYNGSPR